MMMNPAKTKVILVVNSLFPYWGNEDKNILNAAQNNDQLKNIFLNSSYFGIPPDHLISIEDKSSQEILLKVKSETKSSPDKTQYERLIFYYCGHGIPGEDRKLFFAARDTIRSDYEITSVDSNRLFSYLKAFGAKELIIILDCCYAAQTRENQGDADTLIAKCLPEESAEIQEQENGTYYLFAAGKDNVAKFNPKQTTKPTYFTTALLHAINAGTQPGNPYIKMGELYDQLLHEIKKLQTEENTDIPNPRPGLEGNVNGFLFCKNIKYQNQEDKAWADVMANPLIESLDGFMEAFPDSKYFEEASALIVRMSKGFGKFNAAADENDIALLTEVAKEYKDIPAIKLNARKKIKEALSGLKDIQDKMSGGKPKTAEFPNKSSELVNAGTMSEARPIQNGGTSIRDTSPQSPTLRDVKKKDENTVTV